MDVHDLCRAGSRLCSTFLATARIWLDMAAVETQQNRKAERHYLWDKLKSKFWQLTLRGHN